MAVLLSDVWHSAVVKFGSFSSRTLWIKFRTLYSVRNGYRLRILGDLNGWIEDRTRTGIPGAFGVSGENDNSRRVVEFCEERGLCVGNTYFKHRSGPKYTRVARG